MHDIHASTSRTGDCDDNAMVESFVATLKAELIDRQRLHSALSDQGPVAFEEGLTTVRLVAEG